jgi:hypothetical protein
LLLVYVSVGVVKVAEALVVAVDASIVLGGTDEADVSTTGVTTCPLIDEAVND